MFEVLVYLYETYYRPDACPDSVALAKKLSAVGFEQEEISRALGWLTDLAETTNEMFSQQAHQTAFSFGSRVYADQEYEMLGPPVQAAPERKALQLRNLGRHYRCAFSQP